MPYLKIKPKSSLFLGSGKPFNMGEDDWTDSFALPTPSMMFGAIFSILFKKYPDIREKVLDDKQTIEPTCYLETGTIYLYHEKNGTVLLPAPLDLFIEEDSNRVVEESYNDNVITSKELEKFELITPDSQKSAKRVDNYFIDIYYLQNRNILNKLHSFSDFAVNDAKVGIAINKRTRTVDEGKLYRIDLTQLKSDWSFVVEYQTTKQDFTLEECGLFTLGGEQKLASFEHIKEPISITNHKQRVNISNETEFQIYFSTPAIFKKGWIFDTNEHFEIVSASTGKPISIGGFDMKTKKQKKMYRAVPAGSVYLVELKESVNSIKELKERLSIESIHSKRGFGEFEILNLGD